MGIYPSPCVDASNDLSTHPCMEHIKQLESCKKTRVVPQQFVIFSQGEMPSAACFICDGLVKLTHIESRGQRVIVGLRRTGWLLGAANVLSDRPYVCTAETLLRSKLSFVPNDKLKWAMETNASLSLWISTMFGAALLASMISISDRSCLSGRERLEKFLLDMLKSVDNIEMEKPVKLPILLKQWEVAQLLSVTPQYLSRLVKQMENEGLLARKSGWLILLEPKRLGHTAMYSRNFP